MPELRIPLDPCNPGQFYACCGLIELFDMCGARTLSHFEINSHFPRKGTFVLASGSLLDLQAITSALKDARYEHIERLRIEEGKAKTEDDEEAASADYVDKIQPVRVTICGAEYLLDWWLDWYWDKKSALKLWPGKATSKTVLTGLRESLPISISTETPFESGGAFLKSRFGVDPRSAWDALDLGFSPHKHNQGVLTYPLVEILAAFGLQGFRPAQIDARKYQYCLWRSPLPRPVTRSSSVQKWDGLDSIIYWFPMRRRTKQSSCFDFAIPNQM